MKTKFNYIAVLVVAFLSLNSRAQQSALGNSYLLNPFIFNPAEAGRNDAIDIFLTHREQWTGIQDAPRTNFITSSIPFLDKMAVGLNLQYDRAHVYKNFLGNASYSYRFDITNEHKVTFGVNLGFIQSNLETYKAILDDETDLIAQQNLSGASFNADFGMKYSWANPDNKVDVGLSVAQLPAERVSISYVDGQTGSYSLKRHFYLYGKYYRDLNSQWRIEPSFLVRYNPESKMQFDVSGQAWWRDLIWAGLTYRSNSSVFISAGGNLQDQIQVSYSYEYGVSGISNYSGGSHEVTVGYIFREKRNDQLLPDSALDQYARVDTVVIHDTIYMQDTLVDTIVNDTLQPIEEALELDSAAVDSILKNVKQTQDSLDNISVPDSSIDKKNTENLEELKTDSLNHAQSDTVNGFEIEIDHSKIFDENGDLKPFETIEGVEFFNSKSFDLNNLPENMRKVEMLLDGEMSVFVMEVGYYVVHGSFISKRRAQLEAMRYKEAGLDARVYVDYDGFWHRVVLKTSDNQESAKNFLMEVRLEGFDKAWLLKVE